MWAAWMPIARYYLHEYLSLHSGLPGSPCTALASTYSLKDTVTQSPIPSTPPLALYPSSTGSSSGDHTIQILSTGCREAHAWIGKSHRRSMNVAVREARVSNSLTEEFHNSARAAQKAIRAPTQHGLPGSPRVDWEVPSIDERTGYSDGHTCT
ncbi:hypothetical protein BDN71DRAFT_1437312, partial [Pleurotus eryngii]